MQPKRSWWTVIISPAFPGSLLAVLVVLGLGWNFVASQSIIPALAQSKAEQRTVGPCGWAEDTVQKVWNEGADHWVSLHSGATVEVSREVFGLLSDSDRVGVITCQLGWPWSARVEITVLPEQPRPPEAAP